MWGRRGGGDTNGAWHAPLIPRDWIGPWTSPDASGKHQERITELLPLDRSLCVRSEDAGQKSRRMRAVSTSCDICYTVVQTAERNTARGGGGAAMWSAEGVSLSSVLPAKDGGGVEKDRRRRRGVGVGGGGRVALVVG